MKLTKQEQKFCKRFDAEIHDGCLRYYRFNEPTIGFDEQDPLTSTGSTVPSVEITMPVDRFRSFLEIEERLEQLMNSSAMVNGHPGDKMWEEYIRECKIREECPSVKIAYEKYINLLDLVGSNYG